LEQDCISKSSSARRRRNCREIGGAGLVNFAERHHAGVRVGTALTAGTANFMANRRMNKSQQMRWSRDGADPLLHVRCAALNSKLGSGLGQIFKADTDPASDLAMAA
jgi:hypothetical protein